MESQVRGLYGSVMSNGNVTTQPVYVFVSGGGTLRMLFVNGDLAEYEENRPGQYLHIHGLAGIDCGEAPNKRECIDLVRKILADGNR